MPIKAVGHETKIEYQKNWEITSPENTLYPPDNQIVEKLATQFTQAQLSLKKTSYGFCSCVTFLEAKFPQISGIRYARNWPLDAKFGSVGGVVVLNVGRYGHVALITAITNPGYVLDEANFVTCRHTSGRILPFNDPTIIGFWVAGG